MSASDFEMSYRACNKPDYHFRVKQLEVKLSEAAEREEMLKEALKICKRGSKQIIDNYKNAYFNNLKIAKIVKRSCNIALAAIKED